MHYVIPLPPQAALPVLGGGLFPIRRVFCVGRNYADHAREMGADPSREPPFFFTKPADAVTDRSRIPYPPATANLHHEVELVVGLSTGGADLDAGAALAQVYGYGVGVDLTRRDLQDVAKKGGKPWDMAKGFDFSGPCGPLVRAAEIGHPDSGAITLTVNGQERQRGDLSQMIWSVAEVLAHLSRLVTLAPGDLVFTGTPAGVGPVARGDRLFGRIDGVGEIDLAIV
ncbi:MAG: fumarylacetoacetate hydrolase family protein [Alphaproteobacteria bacterium]|nr:fumarylacetoacetate hydrolase family protein [Alphaproteobacteria bacterium]